MRKQLLLLTFAIFFNAYCIAQLPSYVPTSQLKGWWPFHGSLADSSGNNNNGSSSAVSYVSDRFGATGNAVDFSGGSSHVEIPNLPVNINGNYSVNYWMKLKTYTNYGVVMHFHPGTDCGNNPQIWEQYDSLYIVKCNVVPSRVSIGHKSNYVNQWKMVTHLVKSDSTFIYIDGVLKFKTPYVWGTTTAANLTLGSDVTLTAGAQVILDDIGVWGRLLTECEISDLYLSTGGGSGVITQQPANVVAAVGDSAIFQIADVGGSTYAWQEDAGSGFLNLSNTPPYSGVNTKTLKIKPVSNSLNNHKYRCVRGTETCTGTSQAAVLGVVPAGIATHDIADGIIVSPNPAKNMVSITSPVNVENVQLINMLGQAVLRHNCQGKKIDIDISNIAAAVYMLKINDTFVKRIVKEN